MNPFSYGTVVAEPYYFNREEEKAQILDVLSGGNNLVLYAPRRYGKTSLVMEAIKSLRNSGSICVYFDFMTVYSRESFIKTYTKAIFQQESNSTKFVEKFARLVKGIRPKLAFNQDGTPEFSVDFNESKISDETIDSVVDLPERLSGNKKRYIIVMDEFQDIDKLNGENFEKLLRSKIQHHKNVNYLFLGSRTHLLRDMFNNKNRAFYNSSFTMNIDVLPKEETIAFLTEKFDLSKIKIDENTASYLIEKAGYIPYYIQFLASEVWQYCINQTNVIGIEIIDLCSDKIIDIKRDYYLELFDRQTAYQKKLLKAIAQRNKNIFSAEYAENFRLSAGSTTQKAINSLINNGVIEKSGDEYNFDDPFFKQFILRHTA